MINTIMYRVPNDLHEPRKGGLEALRNHLKSIGFPLAANEAENVPDSVIRIHPGYRLVKIDRDLNERIYTVEKLDGND